MNIIIIQIVIILAIVGFLIFLARDDRRNYEIRERENNARRRDQQEDNKANRDNRDDIE